MFVGRVGLNKEISMQIAALQAINSISGLSRNFSGIFERFSNDLHFNVIHIIQLK